MLEFKLNKTEFIIRILAVGIIFLFGMFVLIRDVQSTDSLDSMTIFFLVLFPITITYAIYIGIRRLKNPALILNEDGLKDFMFGKTIGWNEIENLKYKVGLLSSFLIVEVQDKEKVFKKLPFLKRGNYTLDLWRYGTPLVIKLDDLEGDAKANYEKILEFKKQFIT